MSITKYKELYDLSLKVLNEEQKRFNRIDEKASKFFSIFTLLLGAYGFFGKWIIDNLVPPTTYLDNLLIIVAISILLTLFISWFKIFNVLRTQQTNKIPMDQPMIKFFYDNELIDIYYALTKGNKDALNKNLEVTKYKANELNNGYIFINITIILLGLFSILYGIHAYFN